MPPGKILTPFGVEAFGRLGEATENLLSYMQDTDTNRYNLRGGNAYRVFEKLREKTDAILYNHAARFCHRAEHGPAGIAPIVYVQARARRNLRRLHLC